MKKTRNPKARPNPPADAGSPVGYGKPPVESRFKKGQSGNPGGRPKRAPRPVSVHHVLNKKVRILERGKVRWVTTWEAIVLGLTARAIKGDAKAVKTLMELRKLEPAPRADQVKEVIVSFVTPPGRSPDYYKDRIIRT